MSEHRAQTIAEELRRLHLDATALVQPNGDWLVRVMLPGQDGRNALDILDAAWTLTRA